MGVKHLSGNAGVTITEIAEMYARINYLRGGGKKSAASARCFSPDRQQPTAPAGCGSQI